MTQPDVTITQVTPQRIVVQEVGRRGSPGPANLIVSTTDPGLTEPGLWIKPLPGGDFELWVEDGT